MAKPNSFFLTGLAVLITAFAIRAAAQTRSEAVGTLRLRYMRMRAEATDSCIAMIYTSGSVNIEAPVPPADLRAWIDTAKVFAAASRPAKGGRAEYVFIPFLLGLRRTITPRSNAYEFVMTGTAIPILASEVPRIARLLDSAKVRTVRLSRNCRATK